MTSSARFSDESRDHVFPAMAPSAVKRVTKHPSPSLRHQDNRRLTLGGESPGNEVARSLSRKCPGQISRGWSASRSGVGRLRTQGRPVPLEIWNTWFGNRGVGGESRKYKPPAQTFFGLVTRHAFIPHVGEECVTNPKSVCVTEDMDYVADWLVHQGLEKLVDVFKGNSVFSILVYLFIADRKAINAVNTTIAQWTWNSTWSALKFLGFRI